jgi:hypothetical protein
VRVGGGATALVGEDVVSAGNVKGGEGVPAAELGVSHGEGGSFCAADVVGCAPVYGSVVVAYYLACSKDVFVILTECGG